MPPRTRRRMAPPMLTSSVSYVNRILYSDDCLNVLNDPLALPTGSVDLIHLDPPFNSKSIYNLPFAGKDRDARPVEAFTDTWTWGTTEDALLGELNAGPQTRIPADIVSLAQREDTPRSGGSPRIWSTRQRGSWQFGGFWRPQGRSIFIATTPPAIT